MNRTDHRAALSLYTGQAARTREDHTRRRFLVCRTDRRDGITETRTISQHPTEAQALAALARIEQADPHGTYIAAVVQDLRRVPSAAVEGTA